MLTITIVLAVLAFAANLADVLTTYEGVYVKKVASEASSANAWFSDTPLKLLTIKPTAILLMDACFVIPVALIHALPIAICGGGVMIASTVVAGLSALRNHRINASSTAPLPQTK
jgi:hypothetical protein